jgi:YfiH family protein
LRVGPAEVVFTGRGEGDLGHTGRWVAVDEVDEAVGQRRRAVIDRPWSWLRQVHSDEVVVVDAPGGAAGETGDALVTSDSGAALAVLTADCAPVALVSDEGVVAAVHAGWRGLEAGVIERAVAVMRSLGADAVEAALGPCIHAECYEFGERDLDRLVSAFGNEVRATTSAGQPAFDLPAAVGVALDRAGARLVHRDTTCTACSEAHYSHRARQEQERQAVVVWLP